MSADGSLQPATRGPSDRRPKRPYRDTALASMLDDHGFEVRWNERTRSAEIAGPATPWQVLDELREAALREFLGRHYRADKRQIADWSPPNTKWATMLGSLLYSNRHDPMLAYIETAKAEHPADPELLANWLIDLWAHTSPLAPDHAAALEWAGRYLPCAVVARALTPGCLIRRIPVFTGDPDIGKTTLGRELCPSPDWFVEGAKATTRSDELMKDIVDAVVVELGELAGVDGHHVEPAKAPISASSDKFRESYGRRSVPHPRRCVLYGTMNRRKQLPYDDGLIARLLVIECPDLPRQPIEATFTDVFRGRLLGAAAHAVTDPEFSLIPPPAAVAYGRARYLDRLTKHGRELLAEHNREQTPPPDTLPNPPPY